jgi:hypothetical protein
MDTKKDDKEISAYDIIKQYGEENVLKAVKILDRFEDDFKEIEYIKKQNDELRNDIKNCNKIIKYISDIVDKYHTHNDWFIKIDFRKDMLQDIIEIVKYYKEKRKDILADNNRKLSELDKKISDFNNRL